MILRKHFFVLAFFLVVSLVISAFLLVELSRLKREQGLLALEKQAQTLEVQQMARNVEVLKKDLNLFSGDLKDLASYVTEVSTDLPNELRDEFKKLFMRSPSLAVKTPSFRIEEAGAGVVKVTGMRPQIQDWMKENEFFLDQIVKKSLVLEWDVARAQVVVAEVAAGSMFEQLGLKKDDALLGIDGKSMTRGDDIRASLMDFRPKKIALQRGAQKITLDVIYKEEAPAREQVAADFVN